MALLPATTAAGIQAKARVLDRLYLGPISPFQDDALPRSLLNDILGRCEP
jgi:hypothetical protein